MDITCLLSAVLFFTANLLLLIYYGKERQRDHFDITKYQNLNVQTIKDEWDWRIEHRPQYLAAGFINALAWFVFCFPMIQLCWILSLRGTKSLWLHVTIGVMSLSGSLTEWISRFLFIGSSMATEMLYKKFALDNWISTNDGIGYKVLEVSYIIVSGLTWFIDAFEWLAIFVIMLFVHISVRRWRVFDETSFGPCWNAVGLFIALLSLLDFVAEVLRLDGFTIFSPIALWYGTVNRLILIPYWLIVLGRSLPYAQLKLNESSPPTINGGDGNGDGPMTTSAPNGA